jgi:hypothetical protein
LETALKRPFRVAPLDILTGLVVLLALWVAVGAWQHAGRRPPIRVPEVEGRVILEMAGASDESEGQGSRIRLGGRPTILYAFLPDCPACNIQRDHLAELLDGVDTAVRVLATTSAASVDPGASWSARVPIVRLRGRISDLAGLPEVPALYFLDTTGMVIRAYVGPVLSWTASRLEQEVQQIR